jgi:hypothetical protein
VEIVSSSAMATVPLARPPGSGHGLIEKTIVDSPVIEVTLPVAESVPLP